jgi:hypothetical protein
MNCKECHIDPESLNTAARVLARQAKIILDLQRQNDKLFELLKNQIRYTVPDSWGGIREYNWTEEEIVKEVGERIIAYKKIEIKSL